MFLLICNKEEYVIMPIVSVSQHTSELRKPMKNITIKGNIILEGILLRKLPDYRKAMEKRIEQPINIHHITQDIFEKLHPGRYDEKGRLTDIGRSWVAGAMSSILKEKAKNMGDTFSLKDFIKVYLSL